MPIHPYPQDKTPEQLAHRAMMRGGRLFLCCPPNRGHNRRRHHGTVITGPEECLYEAAQRCQDPDLVEQLRNDYRELDKANQERGIWRTKEFKQADRQYAKTMKECFQAGLSKRRLRVPIMGRPNSKARDKHQKELIEVDRQINLGGLSREVETELQSRRQWLLEELDPNFQRPQPTIEVSNPEPPDWY